MSVDALIQDDLVNFRRELISCFKTQHPHIFSIAKYLPDVTIGFLR